MTQDTRYEEQERQASSLFQEGRYLESYYICNELLGIRGCPTLEVLAGANLLYLGRYDEALSYFRDLAVRQPDSSQVRLYLGKILEKQGSEEAIAEYASAVVSDPFNQEAIRAYTLYLERIGDYRGVIALSRKLTPEQMRDEDILRLSNAYLLTGDTEMAVSLYERVRVTPDDILQYLKTLIAADRMVNAINEGLHAYERTHNPEYIQIVCSALFPVDTERALRLLKEYSALHPVSGIFRLCCNFSMSLGMPEKARKSAEKLIAISEDTDDIIIYSEILVQVHEIKKAEEILRKRVLTEINQQKEGSSGVRILEHYIRLLWSLYLPDETLEKLDEIIKPATNLTCALTLANLYQEKKMQNEAKDWYYKAYRADTLEGGLCYAMYLVHTVNRREGEKILIHILQKVKRTGELVKIAKVCRDIGESLSGMDRLISLLIEKFEEKKNLLTTEGRELIAFIYSTAAQNAMGLRNFPLAKRFSLLALDSLPFDVKEPSAPDLLALILSAKEESAIDSLVIYDQVRKGAKGRDIVPLIREILLLEPIEREAVMFLRAHRSASELDLRKRLGTRRVAGIINRIIEKASGQNLRLIEKKGMGIHGEVYEYIGT